MLASEEARGAYVNASRFNQQWVGLGPYRVTRYEEGLIEAERLAIADRIHYNVQPGAPIGALLADEYCARRRALSAARGALCWRCVRATWARWPRP